MKMRSVDTNLVPPDGGWGWMVVFGVAFVSMLNISLLSVFGLLFGDKLSDLGMNTFESSWVGNIMLLITNFSGIISGPALKKYSTRRVAFVGCILSGVGLIASAYSTRLWHFIVSYSIFTGLGIGLIQPSTFMAVNAYFTTKKSMAVGISMAGTGLGQFLMPQLIGLLLDQYGFSGTALVLGALAFNGIIGASLFQPVKWHMKEKNSEEVSCVTKLSEYDENENVTTYGSIKMKRSVSAADTSTVIEDITVSLPLQQTSPDGRQEAFTVLITNPQRDKVLEEKGKRTIFTKIKDFFDLDLLKSGTFLNIIIACGLGTTSNQSFNMFFPMYLQQEIHLDRAQAATCMSAIAAADIVGRITLPTLADKYKIKSRTSYTISCVFLAIARTVLCFQKQYVYIILASTLCGLFRAILVVNQNLIVSEHCKDDQSKLPAALGLNMVMKGLSIITLGQVLGWVRDYTQSYILTIYAQSSLLLMIFVLWTPETLYKYLHKEKG